MEYYVQFSSGKLLRLRFIKLFQSEKTQLA